MFPQACLYLLNLNLLNPPHVTASHGLMHDLVVTLAQEGEAMSTMRRLSAGAGIPWQ